MVISGDNALVVGVAFACGFTSRESDVPEVITAHKLMIVDKTGKTIATLAEARGGASLLLSDAERKQSVELEATWKSAGLEVKSKGDGPAERTGRTSLSAYGLYTFTKKGVLSVGLHGVTTDQPLGVRLWHYRDIFEATPAAASPDGFNADSELTMTGLTLRDPKGKNQVEVRGGGEAALSLYSSGSKRISLVGSKLASIFSIADRGETDRIWLAMGGDGPILNLNDAKGNVRANISVFEDGPAMGLMDKDGKLLWGQH